MPSDRALWLRLNTDAMVCEKRCPNIAGSLQVSTVEMKEPKTAVSGRAAKGGGDTRKSVCRGTFVVSGVLEGSLTAR